MVVTRSGEGRAALPTCASGTSLEDPAAPSPPASGIQVVSFRNVEPLAQASFSALYREHFAYVWRSARRLGVQPSDLDDAVQETFLTVHRVLNAYEPKGSDRAWLFALLFRVVQRHRRSHSRRLAITVEDVRLESLHASAASAPDASAETSETVRLLEAILDGLGPDQRAALILVELEEKPLSEVAEILGISVNTVASRLRMAREHVATAMARHRARDGWRLK